MFSSGFFNSINHDRLYYPSDISRLFNSLLNDGVFENVGDKLIARAGTGMQVIIGSGMAWFNSSWSVNDSDYVVNIDEAPYISGYSRIDGIFLQCYPVDDTVIRENSIYYMAGTQSSGTPSKPVPTSENDEVYIPLCYVTVAYGDTSITGSMIENCVGATTTTPFINGILETVNASTILGQWQSQFTEWMADEQNDFTEWMADEQNDFNEWMADEQNDFNEWFANIQYVLDGDAAGHLQTEIDNIISGALVGTNEM